MILLKIACVGHSQNKDTICIPVALAIKKQRQADSLQVAKRHILVLDSLSQVLQGRLRLKEGTIEELNNQVGAYEKLSGSLRSQNTLFSEKYTLANSEINHLNQQLRRQRTKTVLTGIAGIVASGVVFFIVH